MTGKIKMEKKVRKKEKKNKKKTKDYREKRDLTQTFAKEKPEPPTKINNRDTPLKRFIYIPRVR